MIHYKKVYRRRQLGGILVWLIRMKFSMDCNLVNKHSFPSIAYLQKSSVQMCISTFKFVAIIWKISFIQLHTGRVVTAVDPLRIWQPPASPLPVRYTRIKTVHLVKLPWNYIDWKLAQAVLNSFSACHIFIQPTNLSRNASASGPIYNVFFLLLKTY